MREEMKKQKTVEQDIREAQYAGQRALVSLHMAEEKLGSARNWGIWDMLGGGFFTDMMKHSKISEASSYIEQAKKDVADFQRELRDVDTMIEFHMEIGSFLTFADFFFDGLVADYFVQSKISDAREEVQEAIRRVEEILAGLSNISRNLIGEEN